MAFREATTDGTKALICFYSESGGGKTYSALLLARGLAGPNGRIGMIDTENRRGEFFAKDPLIGGYSVSQLNEPFSPKHFMEAIDEAEAERFDVLVIDSMSHEWEGIGGVLDMASSLAEKRFHKADWNAGKDFDGTISFGDWKEPKIAHKHLIQKLMRCTPHVIICLRAQYKSRQIDKADYAKWGIDSRAKTTVMRDETQSPIQEERFIFEMTVHLQMSNQRPGVPIITKCPAMLLPAFIEGEQITVQTGERMRRFYAGGMPSSPAAADAIEAARVAATQGIEAYQILFQSLTKTQRVELATSGVHEKLKAEAVAVTARGLGVHNEKADEMADAAAAARQDPVGFDDPEQGDEPAGYVPPSFD